MRNNDDEIISTRFSRPTKPSTDFDLAEFFKVLKMRAKEVEEIEKKALQEKKQTRHITWHSERD